MLYAPIAIKPAIHTDLALLILSPPHRDPPRRALLRRA
jgi:hypothetical protein